MAIKIVPVAGVDQVQVVDQPPTEKELNDVAEVKQQDGSSRSIGKVIPKEDALTKNIVKIDAYHKNRIQHQGFIEKPIDMKSDATYEKTTVTLDDGSTVEAFAYVPPEERNIKQHPYAITNDTKVITKPGTFTIKTGVDSFGPYSDVRFNGDISSTEGGNGLIQPVAALAADEQQLKELDRHWRQGEDTVTPINQENFLSRPGMKVKTSETFLGQLDNDTDNEVEDDTEEAV